MFVGSKLLHELIEYIDKKDMTMKVVDSLILTLVVLPLIEC